MISGSRWECFSSCGPLMRREVTHRTWQERGRLHLIPEGKHQED